MRAIRGVIPSVIPFLLIPYPLFLFQAFSSLPINFFLIHLTSHRSPISFFYSDYPQLFCSYHTLSLLIFLSNISSYSAHSLSGKTKTHWLIIVPVLRYCLISLSNDKWGMAVPKVFLVSPVILVRMDGNACSMRGEYVKINSLV